MTEGERLVVGILRAIDTARMQWDTPEEQQDEDRYISRVLHVLGAIRATALLAEEGVGHPPAWGRSR